MSHSGQGVQDAENQLYPNSLLPAIPDVITIEHIITKLEWKELCALSEVNQRWRDAVNSSVVRNARTRAGSFKTLAAMIHREGPWRDWTFAISLCDLKTSAWYRLPSIPGFDNGLPFLCCCVSLQSRLYILGGWGLSDDEHWKFVPQNKVYVLGLLTHKWWRPCASMHYGRAAFACEVKDGKIYVFGGVGSKSTTEVYDPVHDLWVERACMATYRMGHKVVRIGHDFYVHMGSYFCKSTQTWADARFVEVFRSGVNLWSLELYRVQLEPYTPKRGLGFIDTVFGINGRMHRLYADWLYVHHQPSFSWLFAQQVVWEMRARSERHTELFQEWIEAFTANRSNENYNRPHASAAVVMDGEILTFVPRKGRGGRGENVRMILVPVRSRGLGQTDGQIIWDVVHAGGRDFHSSNHGMCAVRI